jgi:hypothetical protein
MDLTGKFSKSSLVIGNIYASDYAIPTPAYLDGSIPGSAIYDMEMAYNEAAGRDTPAPDGVNLGAGNIGGLTFTPGVYKWSTGVTIPTSITLTGNSTDVWIFQIAETLVASSGISIIMNNIEGQGAINEDNIFWQVAQQTTIGSGAIFYGNILCLTAIVLNDGATVYGRLLAQAEVTLIANAIVIPTDEKDTKAPTIISTVPKNGVAGVYKNTAITATFSEEMKPLTINSTTFTVMDGTTPVSGSVSYSNLIAVFTPENILDSDTTYTATITTGVKDLSGNALASNKVWTFKTGLIADSTAPTISTVTPKNGTARISMNTIITATFSEEINPLTINTATFVVMQNTTQIAGNLTYSNNKVTFTATSLLLPNTKYVITITTGVKDLAGNALNSDYVWSFTTGASSSNIPGFPVLMILLMVFGTVGLLAFSVIRAGKKH